MSDTLVSSNRRADRFALILIGALVLTRFAANFASPLNLYADEAQYWRWGQTLEWGYYSKPPMIAWVLHVMTAVFGDTPFGVRAAAPVLHGVSALFLYALGRDMLSGRAGLLAAATYLLMPAVTLSSGVMSTDGVLMPFWSASLYCLWRLRSGKGGRWTAAGFGVALGLGLLSKYAMVYFFIGIALAALIDPPTRKALLTRRGALAGLIAALIVAPHFWWNAAHDFQTVSHTVDNANLGGDLLNPENALTFFVDQLGVFGPISFLALIFGLVFMQWRRGDDAAPERWLLCFILPVLILILAQSVLSRANANWAATAYPAASVLVVAWLLRASATRRLWWIIAGVTFLGAVLINDFSLPARLGLGAALALGIVGYGFAMRHRPAGLIGANIGLNAVLALVFMAAALLPASFSGSLGLDNAMKRARGWDSVTAQVLEAARAQGATAVLVDEREAWHTIDYYGRDRTVALISWRRYPGPKSFSEREPLSDALAKRVLVASFHDDLRPHLRSDFASFEPAGRITVPLGQRANGCPIVRSVQLYIASGYAPPERNPAWEARFVGQREFPEPRCKK